MKRDFFFKVKTWVISSYKAKATQQKAILKYKLHPPRLH